MTRKKPNLASRLDDEIAGLGHNREPEITAQFSAKARASNHQKNTGALAYNACSMRAYEMEPKAQCSRRRRACTGYVLL